MSTTEIPSDWETRYLAWQRAVLDAIDARLAAVHRAAEAGKLNELEGYLDYRDNHNASTEHIANG